MKKIIIPLLLVFLLTLTQVTALTMFVNWPDGGTDERDIYRGNDVAFNYESFDFHDEVHTNVALYSAHAPYDPIVTFVDQTNFGETSGYITFETDDLSIGAYGILAEATTNSGTMIAELDFNVINPVVENTAPYFDFNIPDYFEYYLSEENANLFNVADYANDDEDDVLSYSLDQTNTDSSVVQCNMYFQSSIYCEFVGTGITTIDVIVSDGELSASHTITIRIIDDSTQNSAPYFIDVPTPFSYPISLDDAQVVQLSDYAYDDDNDDLSFSVSGGDGIVSCSVTTNDVLFCDILAIGSSDLTIEVSDGELSSTDTITINIYDDADPNTAPYFNNVPVFFEYYVSQGSADLLDLADYAYDDENDELTFSIDESIPGVSCYLTENSVIHCDFNQVIQGVFTAQVSDGEFTDSVVITISIIEDPITNTAPFWNGLPFNYEYNIDLGSATLVQLSDFAFDNEGDSLSYVLDESNTDFSIADCVIDSNNYLECNFEGNLGTTNLDVIVSDGELSATQTLTITIFEDENFPPQWSDELDLYYSYNINENSVTLFNVFDYVSDPDGDSIDIELDESSTDFDVVNCFISTGTNLVCVLEGVGTTTIDLIASDDDFDVSITITINVFEDQVNQPPVWSNELDLYYSYHIDESPVSVITVPNFVSDPDGDSLDIDLDESSTDFDVINCFLSNNDVLVCILEGVGTTTITLTADDGEYEVPVTLTINVYDDGVTNTAPYFLNLPDYFEYPLSQGSEYLVDLADYAYDDENDPLTFSLNENIPGVDCQILGASLLYCTWDEVITSNFVVSVSDGEFSDSQMMTISIYDDTIVENHPPVWSDELDLYYSYHIDESPVSVIVVGDYVSDPDGDSIDIELDESNTDFGVVNCFLSNNDLLVCILEGVGTTTITLTADDGEFEVPITLIINVYDDENTAPEWDANIPDYFEYELSLENVNVLNLANYVTDAEDDDLTFSLDQSNTDFSVIDCTLQSISTLNCDLNGVGLTTLDVLVSDGEYSVAQTIIIRVIDTIVENHPPVWSDELDLYYSYNIDESPVSVVTLSNFVSDPDGDSISITLDESNTDFDVFNCFLSNDDLLVCVLEGVGTSTINVIASDGEYAVPITITINVYEVQVNHPPIWSDELDLYYSYNIDESPVSVVNLDDYVSDPDGDTITFDLDESNTDFDVMNCFISNGNLLVCILEGVGITPVSIIASDGEYEVPVTIVINVYDDVEENTPPEWDANIPDYFEYELSLENVDVLNLANYAYDDENDPLTFSLDQSATDFSVVDCTLQSVSTLNCDLNEVGLTTLNVLVSDGEFSVAQTIIVKVIDTIVENHPPVWSDELDLYYSYHIDESPVSVVTLSNFVSDPDGDSIDIELDESSTNFDVLNCFLSNDDLLVCVLEGEGTTTIDLIASDGEYEAPITITINVYDTNEAPSWSIDLPNYFSYPLSDQVVTVIQLDDYAIDADDDVLVYSIDESNTNANIVDCFLDTNTNLICVLNGVGTSQLDVMVSDGELSDTETIVIDVYDDNHPPFFDDDIPLYFEYDIDLQNVNVINLAQYAYDSDGDILSYSIDTTNTDENIITCDLFSSTINCDLNDIGQTTLEAIVSDGSLTSSVIITINVIQDNTPPYFDGLNLEYEYDIALAQVDVVKLNQVAFDTQNDDLTFSLDQTNTDANVVSCVIESDSTLHCELEGVGTTTLDVLVSDSEFTTSATITITVFEVNEPPVFSLDMPTEFTYPLSLEVATLLQVSNYVTDPNGDDLTYTLDTTAMDTSVVSCAIDTATSIECDLNGVGTTTIDVLVSDGEFTITKTITINVYNDNTSPYFGLDMPTYFEYNISLEQADLLIVSDYVFDDEDDILTYSLDTTNTDPSIASCFMLADTAIRCVFADDGLTTMNVVVSDGEFTITKTLTLNILDDIILTGPIAIISADGTRNMVGTPYAFNGFSSYTAPNEYIVSYEWSIMNPDGVVIALFNGPSQVYTFTDQNEYTIQLTVTDSQGLMDTTTHILQSRWGASPRPDFGPEDGLFINSLEIYGYDFEQAYINGEILVIATIENIGDEDLKNVRMVFTIPELGWKIKSNAIDLRDGERETIQIRDYLPDYMVEGYYYPIVSFSDSEVRRSKPMYLEVQE